MITDLKDFTSVLVSLLKYYHKPTDEFIKEAWFGVCNAAELTNEEFKDGAILCMRRRDFLPPIDDFIKLVKGNDATVSEFEASEIWDRVCSFLSSASSSLSEHVTPRREFLTSLPSVYTYALNKLGGLQALSYVPTDQLHWKRKEFMGFCKSYRQIEELRQEGKVRIAAAAIAQHPVRALPQSTLDTVSFSVIDTSEEREPELVSSRGLSFESIGDALF